MDFQTEGSCSAARTGYWDFGVNRRCVEQLQHALQSSAGQSRKRFHN